jgi:NAD(P)H-dependent flavin oxidoreductase YrpB (nitropropane dioxygenase family)
VWVGTAWLATGESEALPSVKRKLIEAGSEDTVITRAQSGKSNRQLRTAYQDEWAASDAAEPLKMPSQDILVGDLLGAIVRHDVEPLIGSCAGQGVAWTNGEATVAEVMDQLVSDARVAVSELPVRPVRDS